MESAKYHSPILLDRKENKMAYQKKTAVPVETKDVEQENVETEIKEEPKIRKYEKEDIIPCRSFTNGKLLVTGEKSGILYRWADYGDIEEVEYQDLVYMIRSHKACITRPRFIIQDEEFLTQYPDLKTLYDSLYTQKDLTDILNLPVYQMKSAIAELPNSARESLKGIAASMIMSGKYDSVKKITALDEIFETHLLLTLAQR